MTEAPIDPAACKVVMTRHGAGALASIAVIFPPDREMAAYEVWADGVDQLVKLASDEEPGDPHDGKLPSDRAFILAAMRHLGLPIPDDDFADDTWRSARMQIETRVGGAPAWGHITTAGEAWDGTSDEDVRSAIRNIAMGHGDTETFGGGAAPEVTIRRAPDPRPVMDSPMDGRRADPAPALVPPGTTLVVIDPFHALLAAAKGAEWIMSRALAPEGAAPTDMERHRDALRAAIAQAEGC